MADSTSGNLTLPTFDDGESYILRGSTLNAILDVIKENKVELTGNLQWEEIGPGGSKLPLQTSQLTGFGAVTLDVCIDGSPVSKTFITLEDPNSPIWTTKFVTLGGSNTDPTAP